MDNYLHLHPFVRQVVADKIRGAVVGSALGDSIGLYTEFLSKSMSREVYPEGRFKLTDVFTEGSWTDDTDHSLLIILSFLHYDGTRLSSHDFAKRLKTWIEQGLLCLERLPLDVGATVSSVVRYGKYLDDPKASAFRSWANSGFHAAANGSLMRTYPLGIICLQESLQDTFDIATDFCLVTHADLRCVVSCCIATAIIRGILRGDIWQEDHLDSLIDEAATYVESFPLRSVSDLLRQYAIIEDPNRPMKPPPPLDRKELYMHTTAASYSALQLDDVSKIGYVYKCLGSSILCLRLALRRLQATNELENNVLATRNIFEDLITELVMEGGDADTNAAVAGAFLGCLMGFTSLPSDWYDGMQNIGWLLTKTDGLIQTVGVEYCATGYVGSADPDAMEDGGKGILTKDQLKAREKTFTEMYVRKSELRRGENVSSTQGEDGRQSLA